MSSDRGWATALVAAGGAARLATALWLGGSLYFVDESIYLDAARHLLAGDGFAASYTNVPAYPVVLALLAAPWPDQVVLVRAGQAVLTAFGVLPLLSLGHRLFAPGPARAAGVLYALDPLMVVSGALLYAEGVATIVLLTALLATWHAGRGRIPWAVAAGALLGWLVLLRPVALVVVPVVAAWVAAVAPRRRWVRGIAVVAGCALVLAPWTARNHAVHGGFVPISTAGTQGAPVDRAEIARHGVTAAIARTMWSDPENALRRLGRELTHFWEPYPNRLITDNAERRAVLHEADPRLARDAAFPSGLRDRVSALSYGAELILALAGLPLAWWRHRASTILLVAVSGAYGVGYALFIAKLRYRIPVLPCVFLLAGVAVAAAAPVLRRSSAHHRG